MFREVAITLVALAAFDYFYLDGKYVHSIEMATRSMQIKLTMPRW
jgi:hypothetical protein